eukprot:SAG31_NODE_8650_length_1413_cov_3.700152_1_plen_177_part_00
MQKLRQVLDMHLSATGKKRDSHDTTAPSAELQRRLQNVQFDSDHRDQNASKAIIAREQSTALLQLTDAQNELVTHLQRQKQQAVADEDYQLAAVLKQQIDDITAAASVHAGESAMAQKKRGGQASAPQSPPQRPPTTSFGWRGRTAAQRVRFRIASSWNDRRAGLLGIQLFCAEGN